MKKLTYNFRLYGLPILICIAAIAGVAFYWGRG